MTRQTCVFTAPSLVPKSYLMRECYLIHLTNSPAAGGSYKAGQLPAQAMPCYWQKCQRLACWIFKPHSVQMLRIAFGNIESIKYLRLVTYHARDPIHLGGYTRRALKLDFAQITKKNTYLMQTL